MRRTVVYIMCPMRKGDWDENVRKSIDAAERLRRKGYSIILPSLSWLWSVRYQVKFDDWMEMDYGLIAVSDCVLRVPGESEGGDLELDYAVRQDITIFLTELELMSDMPTEQPDDPPVEVNISTDAEVDGIKGVIPYAHDCAP